MSAGSSEFSDWKEIQLAVHGLGSHRGALSRRVLSHLNAGRQHLEPLAVVYQEAEAGQEVVAGGRPAHDRCSITIDESMGINLMI